MIQASEARKVQEQAKLTVVDEKLLHLETRILELAQEKTATNFICSFLISGASPSSLKNCEKLATP